MSLAGPVRKLEESHRFVPERRASVRRPLDQVDVVFVVVGPLIGPPETALLLEVSDSGMAMRALRPLTAGLRLTVEFRLPGTEVYVRPNCEVVWGDAEGRAGIKFLAIEEQVKLQLERLVRAPQARVAGADRIAYLARSLTNADGVAIALRSENGAMVCCASLGSAPEVGMNLDPGSGLSGECVRTGRVVSCADAINDPRVHPSLAQLFNMRSVLIVPISSQGATVGVLEVLSSNVAAFSSTQVADLEQIAEAIGRAVEEREPASAMVGNPAPCQRGEPAAGKPAARTLMESSTEPSPEVPSGDALAVTPNEPTDVAPPPPLSGQATSQEQMESADPLAPMEEQKKSERDLRDLIRAALARRPAPAFQRGRALTAIKYVALACGLLLIVALAWAVLSNRSRVAPAVSEPAPSSGQPLKVSPDVTQQHAISQPAPVLSGFSRNPEIEGEVVSQVVIARDGRVKDLRVISGNTILAQAAAVAVRKWRSRPFYAGGYPAEAATTVAVKYPFIRR